MIFKRKVPIILAIAALAVVALAACSSGAGESDIVDRNWKLVNYGLTEANTDAVGEATIQFDGGSASVSGSTGCNEFSGDYTVDGSSLSIGPLTVTERACGEPAGVMEQEAWLLRALQAVESFTLGSDQLRLRAPLGGIIYEQ